MDSNSLIMTTSQRENTNHILEQDNIIAEQKEPVEDEQDLELQRLEQKLEQDLKNT
jgi:hypothetical protein